MLVALSNRGFARLVVSTARGARVRGVRRGSSLRTARGVYPGARRVGRGLYATSSSSPIVFGVKGRRVRFVAVADRRLVRSRGALRAYLRRLRL